MTDLCKVTQLVSSIARIRISVISPLTPIFVKLNNTIRLHLNLVVYNRNSKRTDLTCKGAKQQLLIHLYTISSICLKRKNTFRRPIRLSSQIIYFSFFLQTTSFSFVWLNNKKPSNGSYSAARTISRARRSSSVC